MSDTLEIITREAVGDILAQVLTHQPSGELIADDDIGRLETALFEGVAGSVDKAAAVRPVQDWRFKMAIKVVEDGLAEALNEWTNRRAAILRVFVDPAIAAVARRQGFLMMATCAEQLAHEPPRPPPTCCSAASVTLVKTMRRDMLAALDRPPLLATEARHSTADALAWITIRDYRRGNMCGCG